MSASSLRYRSSTIERRTPSSDAALVAPFVTTGSGVSFPNPTAQITTDVWVSHFNDRPAPRSDLRLKRIERDRSRSNARQRRAKRAAQWQRPTTFAYLINPSPRPGYTLIMVISLDSILPNEGAAGRREITPPAFTGVDHAAFRVSRSIRILAVGPDEAGFWPVIN
jgi:hypothetical protein